MSDKGEGEEKGGESLRRGEVLSLSPELL